MEDSLTSLRRCYLKFYLISDIPVGVVADVSAVGILGNKGFLPDKHMRGTTGKALNNSEDNSRICLLTNRFGAEL